MTEPHRFRTVWLSTNYSCNNRCVWCYASSNDTANFHKSMPLELAVASLKLCKDLEVGNVTLIGGEPTLYSHVEKVIKEAKNNHLNIGMVTNGRKLQDLSFVKELKNAGIDNITISIEGCLAETHDNITKIPGSFYETVQGLENCLSERIRTTTETTISRLNKTEMNDLILFLKNKGLSRMMFNLCSPSLVDKFSIYAIGPREGAQIIQELYLFGKSEEVEVRSVTPLPLCNFDPVVAREMKQKKALNNSCHVFYGTNFVVDYNGDVLPCVHFSGYPLMNVYNSNGKVKSSEEFRTDFLGSEGLPAKFRKEMWRYPSKKCESDPDFGKCTGGCCIYWLTSFHPDSEIVGKSSPLKLYSQNAH